MPILVMCDGTLALAERHAQGLAARHPSPKKSPGPNKAITPSFPCSSRSGTNSRFRTCDQNHSPVRSLR